VVDARVLDDEENVDHCDGVRCNSLGSRFAPERPAATETNELGYPRTVLVLTWNIHGNRGVSDERLGRIVNAILSVSPDVVLLQEVGNDVMAALADELRLHHFSSCSVMGPSDEKKYGNMIAACGTLRAVPSGWAKVPWPHLLVRATVAIDGREFDVVSAHIPNGSGNGWRKVETLEGLAQALETAAAMPRIVGGDFNEPRVFLADGGLVSFGAKKTAEDKYSLEGDRRSAVTPRTDPNEDHSRRRWDNAVKRVLGTTAPHGLRHAFREHHGPGRQAVTHEIRGYKRWFDHLLVSREFAIDDAGHFDEWRKGDLSDHSAAWARLSFVTSAPREAHSGR
jgi:endonuclease/exonuclease/phosphatase family metal-dependent hydrolase